MATSFYDDQKRRNQAFALAQLQAGSDSSPVQHPLQAVARALQGAVGGYQLGALDRKDKSEQREATQMMAALLGGSAQPGAAPGASVGNPGAVPPMGQLPSMGSRVYDQTEMNPLDAAVAKPEELAVGVPAPKQYASLIGKAAIDNDLPPQLLAAQLKQESGFNPNAVSSAGASGISQFMPGTAREMGVSDPFNPQQAIPAGARYLRQNIDKFGGSVPLGLAAYNAGPGRVERSGGDISRLPAETQGYVRNITGAPLQQQAQAIQGSPPRPNDAVMQMLNSNNPYVQRMGQGLAQGLISQQFKPSEYDYKPRDDGSIVAINKKNPRDTQVIQPGNPQDLIRFEADKEAAKTKAKMETERSVTKPERDRQQKQVADIVTQDIDRAINTIDNSSLPTTGSMGSVVSYIGGTGAHNLSKLLDTVKANAGFQELNKMRQASPTGGALGSITERELALLQATIGNLEQSQDETQLKDNLRRVKNTYLDLIHGPGNGPPRERLTFEERKSAQPSVDDLLKKYGGK